MVTVTHTRTHVYITFANPYLICEVCGGSVRQYHDAERCGCDESGMDNVPCGHIGVRSVCSSWSPVDGCQCQRVFGHVDHEPRGGDPSNRRGRSVGNPALTSNGGCPE